MHSHLLLLVKSRQLPSHLRLTLENVCDVPQLGTLKVCRRLQIVGGNRRLLPTILARAHGRARAKTSAEGFLLNKLLCWDLGQLPVLLAVWLRRLDRLAQCHGRELSV